MQSQDLTQLSESLLSLLSAREDTHQRASPHEDIAQQTPQHALPRPTCYSHPYSQESPYSGAGPSGAHHLGDTRAAHDPWTSSLHPLQADRQVTSSTGPHPSFTHVSVGQHSAHPVAWSYRSSPSDSTAGWGGNQRRDGGSHSLPNDTRFSASTRPASGLWGGSLWSGGRDSIWSPAADGAVPENFAQQSQGGQSQDDLQFHALRNPPVHNPGSSSSGPPPQQSNFFENGHASAHARPAHIPPHPSLSHERQKDMRQQQASSALLAALQSGGQYPMANGLQHSIPSMGSPGHHLHQPANPLQTLFQPQQHQHLQHHQLQPQQHYQAQQQQQQRQQQQQQQHQQAHQLPEAQSPGVPSHVGRMPPPGFPRPLQQNLQEAQRASAPRGFQPTQPGMNGVRSGSSGSQPPPPPPRPALQPPPPPNRMQQLNGLRSVKPQSATNSMHSKLSGNKAFGHAMPKADLAQLSQSLQEVVDTLRPSPEEQQRQKEAFQQVRSVLLQRWSNAQVHLFGSTANCLSICNNNDIDVCLELPQDVQDQAGKGEIVDEMGLLLEQAGMRDVLPLPKARVPVVKFVVPDTNTKVDITVNNILAIVNTKLLRDYAAIDDRLLQLVFVVKLWAKRRQVNDSYRGTLSSYCYVLMCIHLLQQRSPPALPCLQAMQPTHSRTVGQWNCDYFDDVESLRGFGDANKESLAELVWAFFEYWAWRHDYNNSVISIRTGGFLTKSQKEWTRRVGNERHLVCIEDPFEISHDLGRTVDRQTSGVLHKEFERAACIFRDLPQPLDKLMEPYRAGKSD